MIIALSVIAIPAALNLTEVGGLSGMRATLTAQTDKGDLLSLFDPSMFDLPDMDLSLDDSPDDDESPEDAVAPVFTCPKCAYSWSS